MFDFSRFFTPGSQTDQIIQREPVKESDIDGINYVTGSVGQPKTVSIAFENDVEKRNAKIHIDWQVYTYKYEDVDFPTFATSIEQELVKEVK
jgi:hypothetical protein